MSRFIWLVAFASLSSIACGSSEKGESREAPAPEGDEASPDDVQPGTFVSDGADGLRLEMGDGALTYRCSNNCSAVCTDCLYEACLASGGDSERCVRSRNACNQACSVCPQGGTVTACFSPCLKGEPTCYTNLDLVLPDDVIVRPDVTPGRDQGTPEQTPESDGRPTNESTPSSSSQQNSGRPADY